MENLNANESTQYLESVFNTSHEGIVVVDPDGLILRINPAFTNILGYEENEILEKPFYIVVYKDKTTQKITSHNPLVNF